MIFNTGRTDDARALVMEHHYSRRWPSNVQLVATLHEPGGLFGDMGEATAACVLCIPPTRWAEPVLELARLVRDERPVPLTALIAFACKQAKRQGADLLVSFADWTQEHHGGVYQAASWAFDGKRDRTNDGVLIDGVFYPGRTCNSLFGTRSPERLRERGMNVEPHYDEGKYLYWRALNKQGRAKAARLGLVSNAYPKPLQRVT